MSATEAAHAAAASGPTAVSLTDKVRFVQYVDEQGQRTRKVYELEVSQVADLVSGSNGEFWQGAPGSTELGGLQVCFGQQQYAFVRAVDVPKLLGFLAKYRVFISIRNTGPDSIRCLSDSGAGYACKGHDIMDKTLKKKSLVGALTNSDGNGIVQVLEKLLKRQAVAANPTLTFMPSPSDVDPAGEANSNPWWMGAFPGLGLTAQSTTTENVREVLEKAKEQIERLVAEKGPPIGLVGWWVRMEIQMPGTIPSTVTVKVPIGVLKVGLTSVGTQGDDAGVVLAKTRSGVGVLFSAMKSATAGDIYSNVPGDAYTGDYDMHCMFSNQYDTRQAISGGATHALSAAVAAVAARLLEPLIAQGRRPLFWIIEQLNQNMGRNRFSTSAVQSTASSVARDRFADLFQHGPQSDYFSILGREVTGSTDALVDKVTAQAASLFEFDKGVLALTPPCRQNGELGDYDAAGEVLQEVHLLEEVPDFFAYYQRFNMERNSFTDASLRDFVAATHLVEPLKEVFRREYQSGNKPVLSLQGIKEDVGGQILSIGIFMRRKLPEYSGAVDYPTAWFRTQNLYWFNEKYLSKETAQGVQVLAATRLLAPTVDNVRRQIYAGNDFERPLASAGSFSGARLVKPFIGAPDLNYPTVSQGSATEGVAVVMSKERLFSMEHITTLGADFLKVVGMLADESDLQTNLLSAPPKPSRLQ